MVQTLMGHALALKPKKGDGVAQLVERRIRDPKIGGSKPRLRQEPKKHL